MKTKKEKLYRTLTRISVAMIFLVLFLSLFFIDVLEETQEAYRNYLIAVLLPVMLFAVIATIFHNQAQKHTERREQEEHDLAFLKAEATILDESVTQNPDWCKSFIEARNLFLQGAKTALEKKPSEEFIERELKYFNDNQ